MSSYSKTALLNAAALGAFAVGTALILGLTFTATKEPIAESQRQAEAKALLEVIGEQPFDNDLLTDLVPLPPDVIDSLNTDHGFARIIRHQGEIVGFLLPATAPDGYSGDIDLVIGIRPSGELLGARVVAHKETPGLGDKVDAQKSDWIRQFAGLSLAQPDQSEWAVKKDGGQFDAFTGATITPRAVVNIIRTALAEFREHSGELTELALQPPETEDHGDN